jgi:hypothetical protein
MDLNPLSKLWKKLSNNALSSTYANEFMKVIKLVVIQIMGFVEDERTYLTLTFMKRRFHNRLCGHLDCVF